MQADGRLVEDVQHAGQAAADLAGQADALRLAAGQRRRRPRQREVVEADIDQELQAVLDLAQHLAGDLLLLLRQLQALEKSQASAAAASRRRRRCVWSMKRQAAGIVAQPRAVASEQGTSLTRWSSRWR